MTMRLPEAEELEGHHVHYRVRDPERFAGKRSRRGWKEPTPPAIKIVLAWNVVPALVTTANPSSFGVTSITSSPR